MTSPHSPVKGIGIVLREDQEHYVVVFPRDGNVPVSISQHWNWRESESLREEGIGSLQDRLRMRYTDQSVRALLSQEKWQAISAPVLQSFNARLRQQGKRAPRWNAAATPLPRDLGRELVVLAWGIELADPALVPVALRNWAGLLPVECRWFYTMVVRCPEAATYLGRGRAWRHALEAALTENPVSEGPLPQTYEMVLTDSSRFTAPTAAR